MRRATRASIARSVSALGVSLALVGVAATVGCGAPQAKTPSDAVAKRSVAYPGKPALALVTRDGDPAGAFAAAVVTSDLDARGSDVAVALATLVENRLATRGFTDLAVTPSIDGYRVRARAMTPADVSRGLAAIADALSAPVAEAEMVPITKRMAALDHHLLPDPALAEIAACRGEPFEIAARASGDVDRNAVERWRHAAHGLGRVALSAVGTAAFTEAAKEALVAAHAWPVATALPTNASRHDTDDHLYILPAGTANGRMPAPAQVDLAIRTRDSARAVALATQLGEPHGALAERLHALEAPARLVSVTATAHPNGGCVAVRIDLVDPEARDATEASRPRDAELSTRLAIVASVAKQETAVEAEDVLTRPADTIASGETIARRAGDAREAAESAAWWALADVANATSKREDVVASTTTALGISSGRDNVAATGSSAAGSPLGDGRDVQLIARVRAEIDRTSRGSAAPIADLRARVERGQGESWVLVASPCGALDEGGKDAGLAAAATLAEASSGGADGDGNDGVTVEPWTTIDGAGILAHAPARTGETSIAWVRRVANAAARRFAAAPIDSAARARARGELLAMATKPDARALASLADALAPGHPSWFTPLGTAASVGDAGDAAVLARAAALRAGPVRVAVLAGGDDAQITHAAQAVDRWMVRRPASERACPLPSAVAPSRPGTYVVDAVNGATQAWLALPLDSDPDATLATWLASALDGEGGLLNQTLETAGLVRSASARIVGPPARRALVIRLEAPASALDAAVAETRALIDRVRAGALDAGMMTRVAHREAARADRDLATPRGRVVDVWLHANGAPHASPAPTLTSLRAYAAATLRDDAWVIVVARPPLPPSAKGAATAAPSSSATAKKASH